MTILIDGYNLLHAAGIIPRGIGAGTLQRAHQALLNWLVSALPPDQVTKTTVVFDAADPPPGLPRQVDHQGLTVLYSTDHENADALLEELIRMDAVPKRLVVVSSDHRVQRAARRRRAIAIDSDVWYFDLQGQHHQAPIDPPPEAKPPAPLSAAEVQHWLEAFGDLPDDLDQLHGASAEVPPPPNVPAADPLDGQSDPQVESEPQTDASVKGTEGDEATDADLANPFPPGYGEDLLKPGANLDES